MDKKSPEVVELRHRIELAINRKLKTPSDFDYLTRKGYGKKCMKPLA